MGLMSMPSAELRILPCGDAALAVEFGRTIDAALTSRVLSLDRAVRAEQIPGIVETVPTYRSLLVHYDPVVANFAALAMRLREIVLQPAPPPPALRRWRIPVVYGGASGIDLEEVARYHGVSPEQIVAWHMGGDYRVAMIGFTPGWSYLSGLDPRLATPRRASPRTDTPAGTISIGGEQAGVQCLAAPSGWHLLGRTPVRTYHPRRTPVFLLDPGDAVTFYAIDAQEFAALDEAAAKGEPVAELVLS